MIGHGLAALVRFDYYSSFFLSFSLAFYVAFEKSSFLLVINAPHVAFTRSPGLIFTPPRFYYFHAFVPFSITPLLVTLTWLSIENLKGI